MSFDFMKARRAFEEYLNEYDRDDEKIKLKIVHTYGVVACAEAIGKRMGLSGEDMELAKIIALLHDIGRFEQIRKYDSFQPDTMDHAAYGVEILFGEKQLIRRFAEEDTFDSVIKEAIAKHSDFRLEGIEDERILLHARLIRDADKLDNCRVKIKESLDVLLGSPGAEAGKEKISPSVWEACVRKDSVLSKDRVTKMDYWVSYMAQYYDLNFPETCAIVLEENYIPRIAERIVYTEPDTVQKMKILTEEVEEYLTGRAGGK